MELRRASLSDCRELATFARRTYANAYAGDIGSTAVHQHLASNLSDDRIRQMLLEDEFYLAERDGCLLGFAQPS